MGADIDVGADSVSGGSGSGDGVLSGGGGEGWVDDVVVDVVAVDVVAVDEDDEEEDVESSPSVCTTSSLRSLSFIKDISPMKQCESCSVMLAIAPPFTTTDTPPLINK